MSVTEPHALIATASRAFMNYVLSPQRQVDSSENRASGLIRLLDRLAGLMHDIVLPEIDGSETSPPDQDYSHLYTLVGVNFPDFGHYSCVSDPLDLKPAQAGVGDAIDDIVDIYSDLHDFVWKYENSSLYDAVFALRWSYEQHWGRHLRDLQSYLHAFRYKQ